MAPLGACERRLAFGAIVIVKLVADFACTLGTHILRSFVHSAWYLPKLLTQSNPTIFYLAAFYLLSSRTDSPRGEGTCVKTPGESGSPRMPATPTARGKGRPQTCSFILTRRLNLGCRLQPYGVRFFGAYLQKRPPGEAKSLFMEPYEGQLSSVAAELSRYTESKLCDARRCDCCVLPPPITVDFVGKTVFSARLTVYPASTPPIDIACLHYVL